MRPDGAGRGEATRRRHRGGRRGDRTSRGQLVLAAAAVIAVALAPVMLAYLQLGAHPDVRPPTPEPGADAGRFLERAAHEAGVSATGEAWTDRPRAVETVRTSLAPRLRTLETSRVEQGTVYVVTYAPKVSAEWATEACPGGSGRVIGDCRGERGRRRAGAGGRADGAGGRLRRDRDERGGPTGTDVRGAGGGLR